jgi:hypothetical protein
LVARTAHDGRRIAWRRFAKAFDEAMKLHGEHGDRETIVKLIRRARELLQHFYDELPRGRTPAEQAFPRAVETLVAQLEQIEKAISVRRN